MSSNDSSYPSVPVNIASGNHLAHCLGDLPANRKQRAAHHRQSPLSEHAQHAGCGRAAHRATARAPWPLVLAGRAHESKGIPIEPPERVHNARTVSGRPAVPVEHRRGGGMDIYNSFVTRFEKTRAEELSLEEYLELCKNNPTAYATAGERMLMAIGEPEHVDTRNDPRLSRIFANKVIKIYPAFREFYGMEEVIEQVVAYFRHSAQGLEEKKQILYLLGPQLMERVPFYSIKGSPVNESPLGLFDYDEDGPILEEQYGIPRRYLKSILSPWAVKRLHEYNGDIRRFRVVKHHPSVLRQIGIAKTEPGDENNQDISSLVGKLLRRAVPGKPGLHPLLTATQEGNFKGTEGFGAMPFDGIILAHSNESEWKAFRNNKNNEALLDRIFVIKVAYCLRYSEEVKIYDKLIRNSSLGSAVCAPGTLKMMAQFAVLTRLHEPENSSLFSKMLVYDGENLKDTDPKAKSYQEYRDYAGVDEGMTGISTRFAFKILSRVFNFDTTEVAANPVHLMYVLEQQIEREQFPPEVEQKYLSFVKELLASRYAEFIGKEIQTAYLESYSEYGQNIFDRYVTYADFWIQDQEFRDHDTGESFDRAALNAELEKIEKPAGISNPKDFRNEIVNFVLRARAANGGKNPAWISYEKLRVVIEKKMFSNTEELLPVISFNPKGSAEEQRKHEDFVNRMVAKGYTPKQRQALHAASSRRVRAPRPTTRAGDGNVLHQIIDRRLAGKNKSIANRERFLRRVKHYIREAVSEAVRNRSIKDIQSTKSITVPKKDIGEPMFRHAPGGQREIVHPGNADYVKGDKIPRPPGGGAGGQASNEGEGRDDFVFELSREEFMQYFFDDLELPRLIKTHLTAIPSWKNQRAGWATEGTPNNIDVMRSLRSALGRRIALGAPLVNQLRELEEQLDALKNDPGDHRTEIKLLEDEIHHLKGRIWRIPFIDPQAAMFCLMDVSGSMDEQRKDLAKRFFILLYLFLTRNYEKIEVVFIRHHTRAEEVDEDTFFHSTESGGTVVSSALELMKKIVDERYSPTEWNIYGAQASDGDNWTDDSPKCRKLLENDVLPKARYFAYIQVTPEEQNLWLEYAQLAKTWPHFTMKKVDNAADIYPVFRELFEKQVAA
ncbi:hypothetical protein DFQ30_000466 [Apophysomyces sp. BC1015]|nr:hypothetical protein DFQ30_000466 [Apophysomyces sp. BC1015]